MKDDQDEIKNDQDVFLKKIQKVIDHGLLQIQRSTLMLNYICDVPVEVLITNDIGYWRIEDEELQKVIDVKEYNNAIDDYVKKVKNSIEKESE